MRNSKDALRVLDRRRFVYKCAFWTLDCTPLMILIVALASMWPQLATAHGSVPSCRFDDELIPAVRMAILWGLEDLKKSGIAIPFDNVAINPREPVSTRTLRVEIVKDAAASTVDAVGCILPMKIAAGQVQIPTDGPCLATQLDRCSDEDKAYMKMRFREIHGGFSDVQTGYEIAGACYMTNLHACLHQQRLMLLKTLGPRDALSVKGTCMARIREPASITCSAGALKMLLSSEAVEAKAPTIGMVMVFGHELGHLAAGQSSAYDAADNIIDLAWRTEDKLSRIRNQCRAGETMRKRERDADEIALLIARLRLPEIARRWPKQGTTAWLITQSIHQSTNLMRWNNDWQDRAEINTPIAFRWNPGGGVIQMTQQDIDDITSGRAISGRNEQETALAARQFLCEMVSTRVGRWDLLMQSGSTHGTMIERLGQLAEVLRPVKGDLTSPAEILEATIGGLGDLTMRRHRAYLRELEGSVCTLVENPLDCSVNSLVGQMGKHTQSARHEVSTHDNTELQPLLFTQEGSYHEVTGEAGALTMAITTTRFNQQREVALTQAAEIGAAYAALLSQIDEALRRDGGYWIHVHHNDVEVDYNQFAGAFSARIELRAVVRVPSGFPVDTLPALREIRKWGQADDVHVRPWAESRHGVVIHFFRSGRPGETEDSQRVLTQDLRFDQIFDLTAAQAGRPNQPAIFFRDLLAFLHERLRASFGGSYTLEDDNPPPPFYIIAAGLGDNFYLPVPWLPLIDSRHTRAASDIALGEAVLRLYGDYSKEESVAVIFRDKKS